MARDLGLTLAQQLDQETDAHLIVADQIEEAQPRSIGKGAEQPFNFQLVV